MSALPIRIASAEQGGGAGFTLAVPTGTLPGDLVVAFVQTAAQTFTVPADFTQFPDSPQSIGTAGAAGSTLLSVSYRRQIAGAGGFVMPDSGDHQYVKLVTYRGVREVGDPFDVTSGGTETSDTSLSAMGDTTTVDNCLVVVACANATDNVGGVDQCGTWANTDLTNFSASSTDFIQSATGTGGGISINHGEKVTAGAFGATTATLANASAKNFITIALRPALGPWLFGIGTQNSGAAGVDYSWSPSGAYAANDVALLFIESANQAVPTITSPAGWLQLATMQGTGTAGAAAATALTVWWKRAASGSETDVSVPDPGDHHAAVLMVFRNCVTTGVPFDVLSGGVKAAASTSTSIAGVTTTMPNTLVLYATTRDDDLATANWSAWANATLSPFYDEIRDFGTTSGNGGGIGIAFGHHATAGATGTTTATSVASTVEGFLCIALSAVGRSFPTATVHTGVAETVSGTNHTITIPAHATGDRLLFAWAGDSVAESPTWPSPLTTGPTNDNSAVHDAHAWRDVDGSAGWSTAGGSTITLTTASSEAGACAVIVIPAGLYDPATDPTYGSHGGGNSVTPNAVTMTTAWGADNNLFIGTAAHDDGTDTVTGYPADLPDDQTEVRGNDTGAAGRGVATLQSAAMSNTGSDWTLSASEEWIARTFAIKPAPYDASPDTEADAEVTTGTGTAPAPSASIKPNAGGTTGNGAANNVTPNVGPVGVTATGTGEAYSGTTNIITGGTGAATGTGEAGAPAPSLASNAGAAEGTGAAFDATVSTATQTNANAEAATGTGAAFDATATIATNAGAGTGTGAAGGPSSSVTATPSSATGTGAAANAGPSVGAVAQLVAGLGEALGPTATIAVGAGFAAGTGVANNASATTPITFPRHATAAVSVRTHRMAAVVVVRQSGGVTVAAHPEAEVTA